MTAPTPETTPTRDEAVPTDAERFIASFTPKTPRDAMAMTLFKAWVKADPKNIVSEYPTSYLANFVDMADAALASAPAPASGGVDAVALLRDVANTHTQYCETLHRAADILASLSPAATPVSEAGGEPYNVSETHMLGPVEGGQS